MLKTNTHALHMHGMYKTCVFGVGRIDARQRQKKRKPCACATFGKIYFPSTYKSLHKCVKHKSKRATVPPPTETNPDEPTEVRRQKEREKNMKNE